MKKLCAVLLLVLCVFSISTAQQGKVGWSLGYYVTWDNSYSPTTIPWDALTHVSYFQVIPNNNGTLGLPDSNVAKQLISTAHSKGKKVVFSVGGGGYGAQFAAATAPGVRGNFISNIIAYLKSLGYDGIDTDWEGNEVVSQFVAFHKELRDSINKLTPVPCLSIAGEDWNPLAGQVYMYVDMIDDMWYGAKAADYPGYLQTFVDMGAPKSKLAPGIGIDPQTGNLGSSDCVALCNMVLNDGYGGIMIWDIVNKGNVPSDMAAMAPFVPSGTGVTADRLPLFGKQPSLSANYNRATGLAEIRYSATAGNVDIGIFDLKGCLVRTLVHGPDHAGVFEVPFAQACGAPGTYIVKMSAAGSGSLAATAIVAR
jgi:Glycosyl hydrolases family 18